MNAQGEFHPFVTVQVSAVEPTQTLKVVATHSVKSRGQSLSVSGLTNDGQGNRTTDQGMTVEIGAEDVPATLDPAALRINQQPLCNTHRWIIAYRLDQCGDSSFNGKNVCIQKDKDITSSCASPFIVGSSIA